MANTKTSAMTALTGTGRISRPAARQGSTTDYRTVDNFTAAADPTVNDDVTDGYHAGSEWFNTTDNKYFVCQDPTNGAAVWRQVMDASKNLSDLASAGTARNNLGMLPYMDPDFSDSQMYLVTPHSGAAAGALTANRIYMTPIWVPRTRTYSGYGVVLTTTAGTSIIRVGLYNCNSSLQPTTKIDEGAATIDASAATGVTGLKTVAFGANQSLTPGLYFLACVTDGTPQVMRLPAGSAIGPFGMRLSTGAVTTNSGKHRDAGASTLPADETAQTYAIQAGNGYPVVGIR